MLVGRLYSKTIVARGADDAAPAAPDEPRALMIQSPPLPQPSRRAYVVVAHGGEDVPPPPSGPVPQIVVVAPAGRIAPEVQAIVVRAADDQPPPPTTATPQAIVSSTHVSQPWRSVSIMSAAPAEVWGAGPLVSTTLPSTPWRGTTVLWRPQPPDVVVSTAATPQPIVSLTRGPGVALQPILLRSLAAPPVPATPTPPPIVTYARQPASGRTIVIVRARDVAVPPPAIPQICQPEGLLLDDTAVQGMTLDATAVQGLALGANAQDLSLTGNTVDVTLDATPVNDLSIGTCQ